MNFETSFGASKSPEPYTFTNAKVASRARKHAESKTYKKKSISTGSTKQILDPLNHLGHRLPLEYDLFFSSLGNLSSSRPCLELLLPFPWRRLSMLNIRCQTPRWQSSNLSSPSSSARKETIGATLNGTSREEVSNSEVRIIVPRSWALSQWEPCRESTCRSGWVGARFAGMNRGAGLIDAAYGISPDNVVLGMKGKSLGATGLG
jgi:hypothetical protein